MTRRWYSWTHWPTLFAAAVLALSSALLMANFVVHAISHKHRIVILPQHLDGVTASTKPVFSLRAVLSGEYQTLFARDVGTHLPLYAGAVRLRNQIDYSLFDVAGTWFLTIGRHKQLIENAYIDEYCSRDVSQFLVGADAWAKKLRQMQDDTERRGKTFLYVLTPSKVAQYPEYLPKGYPCPSSEADRTTLVPTWLKILRHNGVHVADTIGVVSAAHGVYPFALWPRGGTHWNAVGSALATRAVGEGLQALRHDGVFAPFTFTWRMVSRPQPPDNDLALLMNLIWPVDDYAVPAVSIAWGPASCRKLNVTVVGGSFMIALAELMGQGPCHPHFVEYEYWQIDRLIWPGGKITKLPVDDAERARDVMDADVLIYEENEQVLGHSQHGPALYNFLSQQPGWLPQETAKARAP